MLPWKLRKRQSLPLNQNISSVYFSHAKFQLVSCNLSLAMIWQMTHSPKLPKLCSATLSNSAPKQLPSLRSVECYKDMKCRTLPPWSPCGPRGPWEPGGPCEKANDSDQKNSMQLMITFTKLKFKGPNKE